MTFFKISIRYGLLLSTVALLCTAVSVSVYLLTKDKIQQAVFVEKNARLAEVIPAEYYDKPLNEGCFKPDIPAFQRVHIEKICIAEKNGQPTAYAYETRTKEGYSGDIRFVVGITPTGEILGVRIISHNETPGLGDKIELRVSRWVLAFNHKKISPDNRNEWAVKKDGGKFDQFVGATITPRAVINQLRESALQILHVIKHDAGNRVSPVGESR